MTKNTVMTASMKKITTVALVLGLAACSNTSALEQDLSTLTNKIDALTFKVDELSDEISDIKAKQATIEAHTQEAKESADLAMKDAQNANERIDNIVSSYKK